jgi:transcription initiation factor TFIIB
MDFDSYFNELDEVQKDPIQETEPKCCDMPKNYSEHKGVISCNVCYCEITNIIDGPEWRFYGSGDSKSQNPTRCGLPVNALLPKSSLGSSVSGKNRSESMNKIGMYQRWNSMPYAERSLYKVFVLIDSRCQANALPKMISETAKSLYKILSGAKISRGSNRTGIIAACVFNACKECGAPRSPNELASIFDIDPKVMTKGCKNYTEIMRLSKTDMSRVHKIKSIDLNDFITRFSHKLQLDDKQIRRITHVSFLCQDLHLISDNTPPSMASGCIYLYVKILKLEISKKEISDVCKISEVTINKCAKKLEASDSIMDYLRSLSDDLQ